MPQCCMSHTEVLWYTAFSDGAKINGEGWGLMWSGSAILEFFISPPYYCTWQSLPPIAFAVDISGVLATFPFVCLCWEKGLISNCFVFGCL